MDNQYEDHPVAQRMKRPGPKRILTLDGGGIRGALTLGYLEKIEAILARRSKRVDFRLTDYYDFISGTSTGAIIAAGLSIGLKASEIKEKYLNLGGKIFGSRNNWLVYGLRGAKYKHRAIEKGLKEVFGERTLGDESIKSLLCIVTKRIDTFSAWPVTNNPLAKYYEDNKDIPLWELVRASAAAPTYFKPKRLRINTPAKNPPLVGLFVDGGVTLANNPAFQTFLLTQARGYNIEWPAGEDKLFFTSIGTGSSKKKYAVDEYERANLGKWGRTIPELFMEDASYFNQTMMQFLSKPAKPKKIDSEIGDLQGELLTQDPKFTYVRYNVDLNVKELLGDLNLEYVEKDLVNLRKMDKGENRYELAKIGEIAAAKQVDDTDFPSAFDVTTPVVV